MLTKNQVANVVLWPQQPRASLSLVDADGELLSTVKYARPVSGLELSRQMPDGCYIDPDNFVVVSLDGKIVHGSAAAFDTSVVVERAQISFEDRMRRLERREQRREKQRREEREEFVRRLAELDRDDDRSKDDADQLIDVVDDVDDGIADTLTTEDTDDGQK